MNSVVPYVIFGSVNLAVGLLTLTLPETSGTRLPSNIQEANELEK